MKWMAAYAVTILAALISVYLGSRTVTAAAERIPLPRKYCIVIDPGHGGIDGGAVSCTGKLEKFYNLQFALRFRDLMHLLGYQTKMTRVSDESIYIKGETIAEKKLSDLKERVKKVNEADGGILVSFHQNQFSDSRYFGPQVFYASAKGSKELAFHVQNNLKTRLTPITGRKAKPSAGVYLMQHIKNPGILIECGFLSNPQEEARLSDPRYQKKFCCVAAASVAQFLG